MACHLIIEYVRMKKIVYIAFLTGISLSLNAQSDKPLVGNIVKCEIVNSDTIPVVSLGTVYINADRVFKNPKKAAEWNKLKRDVKKVYPYAILAEARLKEYNNVLETMHNEIERKIYMKKAEGQLKSEFSDELKKLTINQGRILIRLIDRQTGHTSYELVKELRGGFSAFMWQSLALLFGSNLKAEYDPNGRDKIIEDAIAEIESGRI